MTDPGDLGECDDLGVGQLDLSDVLHSHQHIITCKKTFFANKFHIKFRGCLSKKSKVRPPYNLTL